MKKVSVILLIGILTLSGCGQATGGSDPGIQPQSGSGLAEIPSEPEDASQADNDADGVKGGANSVIDVITGGFSAKAFMEKQVSQEDIELILQSGAKAPSAMNLQPWHFTVIRNSEIAGGLVSRDYREGGVVIVTSGKPNERAGVDIAFDCALAAQNMYIAAQSLGLGAHLYYGGVQSINDSMRDTLGIPGGYEAQIILFVGYMDDGVDAVTSASVRGSLQEMVNYIG